MQSRPQGQVVDTIADIFGKYAQTSAFSFSNTRRDDRNGSATTVREGTASSGRWLDGEGTVGLDRHSRPTAGFGNNGSSCGVGERDSSAQQKTTTTRTLDGYDSAAGYGSSRNASQTVTQVRGW